MGKTKITLTTTELAPEFQCPLYKLNEGFALNIPEVLPNSGKACVYVIKELLEPIEEITCKDYSRKKSIPNITCPKGVQFSVKLNEINQDPNHEYVKQLSQIPIFSKLANEELHEIGKRIEVKDYEAGQIVINKGDIGKNFFIVYKGNVQVLQERKGGGTQILTTLSKDECFGEMSLLTGEPCSATIKAATPLILLVLSKENFNELLHLIVALNQHFTKVLAARLRKTNDTLEESLESGVLGKLSMISLPELVQAISAGGRTGILTITNEKETGVIYCLEGNVVDARIENELSLSPEESFYYLLTWSDGEFQFKQGMSLERESKIHLDSMSLLMEGMRRMDESNNN